MCGIVGYIGNKMAKDILIDGLLSLEYRGYDSAGIATIEKSGVCVNKDKGRVNNLYSIEGIEDLQGSVGIAHTRWATHGKPSKENSHPHQDSTQTFTVVHNGIIENYNELREFLKEKGYNFLSQTDTEVIPNLIHYYYTNNDTIATNDRYMFAIKSAIDDLVGSYAIEVISALYPDRIVVARKDSPLVIGRAENENYIASDVPAILKYTNQFYFLQDNELAVVYKYKIEFMDRNLQIHQKELKIIDWDANSASKDGFEDYMLKEIFEQPKAIRETISTRLANGEKCAFEDLNFSKEYMEAVKRIYIVACGTAMHAGLVGKNILEKICKIPTEVEIASEFRYKEPLIDENTLCIYISQSGETADTIAALKLAKSKGAKTLAISNVIGSSITREADYTIYTHAGPEIAVASTKAYTCQVVLICILAMYFAEIQESVTEDELEKLKQDILDLPSNVENMLSDLEQIKEIAKEIYNQEHMFFLGRGIDYYASQEGSLKLKEISYIHSEAYAAGELKHGPIALIENGVTVVCTITDERLMDKSLSNVQEVITRGANTLIVTNLELPNNNYDYIVNIPKTNSLISPVLSIVPMQLLSYYISKFKGLDVDKPRNLAKSVTVE